MKDRLTIYQVAQRYEVVVSTIYAWLNRQWIPAPKKLGGRVFWFVEDLAAWEANDFARPCDKEQIECQSQQSSS